MADRAWDKDEKIARRLDLWEKKLFDLSLRNALLNARMTGNTILFQTGRGEPGAFLEALQTGTSFSVCPVPAQEPGHSMHDPGSGTQEPGHSTHDPGSGTQEPDRDGRGFDSAAQESCTAGQDPDSFAQDNEGAENDSMGSMSSGILRAEGTAHEISLRLKRLQRLTRSSIEETGSANLYWGIGLLRWFDKKTPDQERFAPLLLVPAQISRGQGPVPFGLRAADETPLINQTLVEKLRIDHGLQAEEPDGRARPAGEEGPDPAVVLDRFRAMISPMEGWEVLDRVCLGIFSYAGYMMWEDLHARRDRILGSPIVRSLAGGTIEWKEDMDSWQKTCAETQVLAPVRLDSSQQLAVQAAAAGKSFVLHGPPGTGKSQTITAIIANALAQGKTVLFVAEKMAALSVVQSRLEDLGLEPFCLEVHSRKSRKKDLIEKLRRAAETRLPSRRSAWEALREDRDARVRQAQQYLEHLHKKGNAGLSVWDLMELCAQFPEGLAVCGTEPSAAASLTREDLAAQQEALEKLAAAGRAVGHPCGHPLAPVGRTDYTQQYRVEMEDRIDTYLRAVDLLDRALDRYVEKTGEERPSGREDLIRQLRTAVELEKWNRLPQAWAAAPAPELRTRLQKAAEAVRHGQNLQLCRDRLLKVFEPQILQVAEEEADRLRTDYDRTRRTWAVPRYFGRRRLASELGEYAADGQKVLRSRLGRYTQDIQYYQREYRLYREALSACGDDLDQYRDDAGRIMLPALKKAMEDALRSTDRLRRLTGSDRVRLERAGRPLYTEETARLCRAFEVLQQEEKVLKDFLGFADNAQLQERAREDWFGAQREFCALLRAHGDGLRDWMFWNRACEEAKACGLGDQVEAFRSGLAHEDLIPSWQKSWARAALRNMIEEDPVLNTFSGTSLEEEIEAIRALETDLTGLARDEIRQRIAAGVPDFVGEASEDALLSTFRRIVLSGGKGMGIREILTLLAPVLPRICPCMLMSPASAARYLDLDRPPFDLVIFDEASQITTANAVGVLARGKNAVIVGDPCQMPPTSFFAREVDLAEDPLEDDLGSILEDCIAVNLPQLYLSWHYRSRHESLIAFSNEHFYDGRLLTFPSADDGVPRVTRIYADGQFESGKRRINRAEADLIIRELSRRSRTSACRDQSVGIVTFNIQQQALIEDLFEAAAAADAGLAAWAESAPEPLFIKNLENVQGDERDVILFSTTYGPSEEGRMSLNLGPLNREGGWRRLNVAVTRARREMVVFTSIHPDRDGLDHSLSVGVRMLDAFLRFAGGETDRAGAPDPAGSPGQTGPGPSQKAVATLATDTGRRPAETGAGTEAGREAAETQTAASPEGLRLSMADLWLRHRQEDAGYGSGVAGQVRRELEKRGYDAVCGVGRSGFRVDVGVRDPADPSRYVLGILLDDKSPGPGRTLPDLEIGRRDVLEGLGWNLTHIRAIDWYDNPARVMDRVTARLEDLLGDREPCA